MAVISPHINFNGNAEEAFEFYRSVFGGQFTKIMRFKDLPDGGASFAADEANEIMHIALPIGPTLLTANDVPSHLGRTNENENRSKILIRTESREEADRMFNGLSAGGQVECPMGESFWGSYFGMFRDRYGIEWMIEFTPNR